MGALIDLFMEVRALFQPATADLKTKPNPNGHGDLAVVRAGYTVEKLPGLMRSRRSHTFDDLTSFAEWLNRHVADGDRQRCEILATETAVDADLAPADPYSDTARCALKAHPLFAAWQSILGKPLNQKQLHAFIRGAVSSFSTIEDVNQGDVIAAEVRKVQVSGNAELTTELDETGFYRVEVAGTRTAVASRIPPSFVINVPIFAGVQMLAKDGETTAAVGEARYSLGVLLSMDVAGEGKGILFHLACPELPVVLHQARLDAVAYLRSLLGEGFLVGLGAIGTEDVPDIFIA